MAYDAEATAVQRALAPLPKLRAAYDVPSRTFRPDDFRDGLSSGEGVLLDTATALWRGDGAVNVGRVACALDDRSFLAFVQALVARRGRGIPAIDDSGRIVQAAD